MRERGNLAGCDCLALSPERRIVLAGSPLFNGDVFRRVPAFSDY